MNDIFVVYMYYGSIDFQLHVQKSDRKGTPKNFCGTHVFQSPEVMTSALSFVTSWAFTASASSGVPCSELHCIKDVG